MTVCIRESKCNHGPIITEVSIDIEDEPNAIKNGPKNDEGFHNITRRNTITEYLHSVTIMLS